MKLKNILTGFFLALILITATAATLTRYPIYTAAPVLIQTGVCVSSADGTVSNVFAIPYTSLPQVTATQWGSTLTVSNVVKSISLTNFVLNVGLNTASVSNTWIAIGTP